MVRAQQPNGQHEGRSSDRPSVFGCPGGLLYLSWKLALIKEPSTVSIVTE
jgi:hypothetical protein